MPRRENRTTPKVIGRVLYTESGGIRVESSEWFTWLEQGLTFYFESSAGTFTASRDGTKYWYALRRYRGQLVKRYLGTAERLTMAHLVKVAQLLADRVGASAI